MSSLDKALYINSTLAINPHSGKIEWYFQHVPGESINMEVGFKRVLVDMEGRQQLVTIGKDGILRKLDRETGECVSFVDTMNQTIFEPFDHETGKLKCRQDIAKVRIGDTISACPSIYGRQSWQATAYSPETFS